MQNILITGANRGIGLELTRQFLLDDAHIFASCRTPERADQLTGLAQKQPNSITILQMDINDEAAIDAAVKLIAAKVGALDVLINNAGISPQGDEYGGAGAVIRWRYGRHHDHHHASRLGPDRHGRRRSRHYGGAGC